MIEACQNAIRAQERIAKGK